MTDDLAWLGGGGVAPAAPEVLAEIHATVDLERALAGVGLDPALAGTATEDELLGARVVVVAGLAYAEPSTEGRLAGTLARHDEGPTGRYVRSPIDLAETARRANAAGVLISRPGTGPFGPQVLVLDRRPTGRHLLLVEPRSVPSRR